VSAQALLEAVREVLDPETGLDVVALGLVRKITHLPTEGSAEVVMTLTTPACPAGAAIAAGVRRRLERIPGIRRADVALSFDPPWTPADIGATPHLSTLASGGTVPS
jgi:metal-sulfur cluster biosynthetic enzyme